MSEPIRAALIRLGNAVLAGGPPDDIGPPPEVEEEYYAASDEVKRLAVEMALAARSQPAEGADAPDGVSMVVLDPGHDYLVRSLDGGQPIRITFVKREGSHYPGNVGHYGGTIIQRLAEVIEDRLAYVNNQIPCWESEMAQGLARALKAVLEVRAARTHGRHLEFATVAEFMEALPCTKCGHTGCTRHLPSPPVSQEPDHA